MHPIETYRNRDGTVEQWWSIRKTTHRRVTIETTIKTLQNATGHLDAADVELLLTDQTTPRRIGIPVAVLDQVISALIAARTDAEAVVPPDATEDDTESAAGDAAERGPS